MLKNFSYVRPTSLAEALKHLSTQGSVVHAGGTDLLGCLREGIIEATKVVSISALDELRSVQKTEDGGLHVGSLITITELAEHALIRESYPGLARAASEVASPQLRNQGTLGGNLCQKPRCWYYRGEFNCLRKGGDTCYAVEGENAYHCILGGDGCYMVHPSDTAPVLTAFEATVHMAGPNGTRSVPASEFHMDPAKDPQRETVLEPGEILLGVSLPPSTQGMRSSYRKVRARRSWDFALAGVALALDFDGDTIRKARVVLSGAAPIPWRSVAAEQAITGRNLDPDTVNAASEVVVKDAAPLQHNAYKLPLFRGIIQEELTAMAKS